MKVQIILPMAGKASRFNSDPAQRIIKPLIKVKHKKLYEWSMASFKDLDIQKSFFFVIQKAHQELKDELTKNSNGKILEIDVATRGPGETLLLTLPFFSDVDPVIICDSDLHFNSAELNRFLKHSDPSVRTGVLTFKSSLPQYSYVLINNSQITDIQEKIVISNHAVCGCYYFSDGKLFKDLIQKTIDRIPKREVFLSDVIKTSILSGHKSIAFECDSHISLGTPDEIKKNEHFLD